MSNPQYNPTGVEGNSGQSRSVRTSQCTSTEVLDEFYYCSCPKKYSRYNAYMKHLRETPHEDNNTVETPLIVPGTAINEPDARTAPVQQNSAAFNGEAFLRPVGPLQRQSATLSATVIAEEKHRGSVFVSEGIPAHRNDGMSAANKPESVVDLAEKLKGHPSLTTYITEILCLMLMDNFYYAQYCDVSVPDHQWNTDAIRALWPKPEKTLPPELEGLIGDLRMSPNWPAIQLKFLHDHQGL
jgi:hypothetical protein